MGKTGTGEDHPGPFRFVSFFVKLRLMGKK